MPLELPDVRQRHDHDCLTAAWKTVYKWHMGRTMRPLADLSSPINGTDPATAEAVIRVLHGWNVLAGEMLTGDLKYFADTYRPVICPITTPDGGHYVVVSGVDRYRVHFHDPDKGSRDMTRAKWLEAWRDTGKTAVYLCWGLVAWPKC
jgi:predicted double-glycine peptidase